MHGFFQSIHQRNLAERNGWKHGKEETSGHMNLHLFTSEMSQLGITYHPHSATGVVWSLLFIFPLLYPSFLLLFLLAKRVWAWVSCWYPGIFFFHFYSPHFFFFWSHDFYLGHEGANGCVSIKLWDEKEWHLASFFGSESVELIFYGAGGMALLKRRPYMFLLLLALCVDVMGLAADDWLTWLDLRSEKRRKGLQILFLYHVDAMRKDTHYSLQRFSTDRGVAGWWSERRNMTLCIF